MDAKSKAVYRSLGVAFLVIGFGFAAVAIAERVLRFEFFSGNALPVAILVGLIGIALLHTIRQIREDDSALETSDENHPDSM
jgi:hypothetical protein